MTTLVVQDLRKAFDGTNALNGVSFHAGSGEILALLGPNGAGKTTTLRCLAGLLLPDSGTVTLHDDRTVYRDLRGAVTFVPETPDLYGGLSVAEHLRFVALLYRLRSWEARAQELLDRFQLDDRKDALPGELSQGMRRKVVLIMALLHGAKVVLMDEPFNGLDPKAVRELREMVVDLAASGVAVVLSTHRLAETERLAHRVAVTYRGTIRAEGALPELRRAAGVGPDADLETAFLALTDGSDG
jgi:ABC-2 type transport system ATP-binding protein